VIKEHKDGNGYHWEIPADKERNSLQVWWNRKPPQRKNGRTTQEETLIIRQVRGDSADVIEMTLGQAYDLIKAVSDATEKP
jgi:hypothetical protein